ncbi:MAG TPA: hypothetical protein VGH66_18730, partial [Acidimicrobiales bacterium]
MDDHARQRMAVVKRETLHRSLGGPHVEESLGEDAIRRRLGTTMQAKDGPSHGTSRAPRCTIPVGSAMRL